MKFYTVFIWFLGVFKYKDKVFSDLIDFWLEKSLKSFLSELLFSWRFFCLFKINELFDY
jgi:hypothetical protein